MALFEVVKKALWFRLLAASIKIKISEQIIVYKGNNGCISVANNRRSHKRSKDIVIKYQFLYRASRE